MDAPAMIRQHTLNAALGEEIRKVQDVVDVGAGIRPLRPFPANYVRIEPSEVYAAILSQSGESVINDVAINALDGMKTNTVLMFDVIEHMEKDEGEKALALAKKAATDQVVVFTPRGFMNQESDAWGLDQDYWQKHRSGWNDADFDGARLLPGFYPGFIMAIFG